MPDKDRHMRLVRIGHTLHGPPLFSRPSYVTDDTTNGKARTGGRVRQLEARHRLEGTDYIDAD